MTSEPISYGYVILTRTKDIWAIDWDGEVHTNRSVAEREFEAAATACGRFNVRLMAVLESGDV